MKIFPNFQIAALRAAQEMLEQSYRVHSGRWQGMDISSRPEAEMHEMLNWVFQVPLNGKERLTHYQEDIEPNLPWADDHFAERVGGWPLNPGEQWKNWPWGNSADKFRTQGDEMGNGPLLSSSDWAYFAGFFDGEGTIAFHTQKDREIPHIRLQIGQKDPASLHRIVELLRVGTVVQKNEQTKELNGREYTQQMWRWAAGCHAEVLWILKNALPFLVVKRSKAVEAIEHLENNPPSSQGSPRRTIWDQEWPERFSHSYMQRMWPRFDNGVKPRGMMYEYADLNDLVDHLAADPLSRQAYLPIWFPEDGTCRGRKPCTLGYWFIARNGYLHMHYPIRSCDIVRHFRDDCYMGVRLLLWILDRLREKDPGTWTSVRPGMYTMWIGSFHCFLNDHTILRKWLGR